MINEATLRVAASDLHVPVWEGDDEYAWKLDLPQRLPNPDTLKEGPHEFDNVDWKAFMTNAFGGRPK